jgi:hypothetical protein
VPGDGPYRLTGETPDGIPFDHDDPYRFGPVLGELDEYLLGEGTHRRLWDGTGRPCDDGMTGWMARISPSGRRTRKAVSVVGDFNGWNGSAPCDAAARRDRRVGDLPARHRRRRGLQIRASRPGRGDPAR